MPKSRKVEPSPGNPDRKAMVYNFLHLPGNLDFHVGLNHSPGSKKWDRLTNTKRETVFRNLAHYVGARKHNSEPSRWIIFGDPNTPEGLLQRWASEYWHAKRHPMHTT